jgi:hypothetical protein
MKPEHIDALSALIDGEPVDPAVLADSLTEPGAAELLADFASLRVLARAPMERPSPAFYQRMTSVQHPSRATWRWLRRFRTPALAASWLVVGLMAGYALRAGDLLRPRASAIPRANARVALSDGVRDAPVPRADQASRRGSSPTEAQTQAPPMASLRVHASTWQESRPRTPGTGGPNGLN